MEVDGGQWYSMEVDGRQWKTIGELNDKKPDRPIRNETHKIASMLVNPQCVYAGDLIASRNYISLAM